METFTDVVYVGCDLLPRIDSHDNIQIISPPPIEKCAIHTQDETHTRDKVVSADIARRRSFINRRPGDPSKFEVQYHMDSDSVCEFEEDNGILKCYHH